MVGWDYWLDKKVFLTSSSIKHPFEGKVIDVEEISSELIYIIILDKYNKRVRFNTSDILVIKEEE